MNPRTMLGSGLLHIAQGKLESASGLLYSASEHNLLSSFSLSLHAWSDYLAGNFAEAMEHIAEVRAGGGSGSILAAVEALTAAQVEPPLESVAHLECLLEEHSGNDVVRGALGYVSARSGDEARARAILAALSKPRSHAKDAAHYSTALTCLGLNQTEDAITSLALSYKDGSLWSLAFHLDPALRRLKQQPGFGDFLRAAYPASSARAARSQSVQLEASIAL
jgi:hypothetical protein